MPTRSHIARRTASQLWSNTTFSSGGRVPVVRQASARGARGHQIAWAADVPGTKEKYLAVFNLHESPAAVAVAWSELGLTGTCVVRDLWKKQNLGAFESDFAPRINPHGAGLYRVRPL